MELIKYRGNLIKERLHTLFNNIWTIEQIPKVYAIGLVISIHKKGDKNKCENYRGITLLSVASKLYANIIKNKYIEEYLKKEQCGFRKGRVCTDATFTLQKIIEK
jgi:hypothetical protein